MRELVALENQSGIIRTYLEAPAMSETLGRLIRKNKESYEESGAKILYLSMGFLKWYSRTDGAEHYAPLVLLPVQIKRSKGASGYALTVTDEEYDLARIFERGI